MQGLSQAIGTYPGHIPFMGLDCGSAEGVRGEWEDRGNGWMGKDEREKEVTGKGGREGDSIGKTKTT
jgi:hypothetical protein